MKTLFYIVLAIVVLIVVRSPKNEPFAVPPGGAPVYAAPGDSLPATLLAEGDTVRLRLLDATYSTFRKNDKTWYMKRTDLVPLYWVGKMERMEQRLLDKYSLDRLPQRPAGDPTLPLLFQNIAQIVSHPHQLLHISELLHQIPELGKDASGLHQCAFLQFLYF